MIKTKKSNKFDNKPYARKVEKPWGFEIHWVREGMPYMGKILHINKDQRLSLQYHDMKRESWFIKEGKAKIIWEDASGELVEVEMESGKGYTCDIGQRHRFIGITDCDIVEVSTPEIGITYRLEDDYKREDETPQEREKRNKGEI